MPRKGSRGKIREKVSNLYPPSGNNQFRLYVSPYRIFGHNAFYHIGTGRHFVHHITHDPFNNGTQSAGSGLPAQSFFRDGSEGALFKYEFHVIHAQEMLVLLDQRILRFL